MTKLCLNLSDIKSVSKTYIIAWLLTYNWGISGGYFSASNYPDLNFVINPCSYGRENINGNGAECWETS